MRRRTRRASRVRGLDARCDPFGCLRPVLLDRWAGVSKRPGPEGGVVAAALHYDSGGPKRLSFRQRRGRWAMYAGLPRARRTCGGLCGKGTATGGLDKGWAGAYRLQTTGGVTLKHRKPVVARSKPAKPGPHPSVAEPSAANHKFRWTVRCVLFCTSRSDVGDGVWLRDACVGGCCPSPHPNHHHCPFWCAPLIEAAWSTPPPPLLKSAFVLLPHVSSSLDFCPCGFIPPPFPDFPTRSRPE